MPKDGATATLTYSQTVLTPVLSQMVLARALIDRTGHRSGLGAEAAGKIARRQLKFAGFQIATRSPLRESGLAPYLKAQT